MHASARLLRRLSSSSSTRSLRRLPFHPSPPPPPHPAPLPPLLTLTRALLPHLAAARFSTISCASTPSLRLGECGALGTPAIPLAEKSEGEDEVESAAARHDTDAFAAVELALDSVVKVFTVSSGPNYFLPWQNKAQRESMGSGFVISGKKIITNAHVVADHTFVLVRKHGSPTKYKAEVQAIGHECDLALLTVESEEFWEGMNSLDLGDIPFLQEAVAVVGYPQGGDNISVTKGVVSRVEPTQYAHGATQLMAIQIDAAINPGNSGGPAIMGDKVAGVAFQNLSGAENIGYIIPVPVIKRFISGVEESGKYSGFCSLGISCQATENIQIRECFGMRPEMTGVLVSRINPLSDAHKILKKDDILLEFDGVPIANDGTVPFRNRERITFDHLVSMKKPEETAVIKVLRDGKEHELNVTLRPLQPLVPVHQFDKLPSYYIFAAPKMKMNPKAQVKRRKVISSKPTTGGSGPNPPEDPTSTAPELTAPPASPAEPAATEASREPPTESAAAKTAPAPPAKPAASKTAKSSKAPPATPLAEDIQAPEVEVTGVGFNPPVRTVLAKHTGDPSKTERKFEAPDLSAFTVEELHAGFLSRLYTYRDEELELATQLKQKHEETVADLRNIAAASQTAREVAEEKLKVAVQTVGDLQKELSDTRKAAEAEAADLRKRAEDAESRLKAASEEISGLRDHISRMTEAIFGKKSRQLSADSILKLKAVYTLTEQLYCGAACSIKALLRKRSVPTCLKDFLDTLSTLPDQINEARKSAARKNATSALSLALAYSPELPIDEMAGGYPSLKEDGSPFSAADFDQCVQKARVLASTLADEEDLTRYQAAYSDTNERIPAPKFMSNNLTPSSSKQPFAPELDPSPFFEEGEFETLLHCNWDINDLQIQDPAPEDPAQE